MTGQKGTSFDYVRNAFALLGAAALLTGLAALVWNLFQGGPVHQLGPDDERPPVVVSDGSIEMNAVEDRSFQSRGKWQKEGGVFFHEHQGNEPTSVVAHLLYGLPAASGTTSPHCADPSYQFSQTSLTIQAAGDVTQQVTVAIQARPSNKKRYLSVTPGNGSDVRGQFLLDSNWLRAGNSSNKLSAVTFIDGADAGVTCDLGAPRALLVLYQSLK